jgi:hypothetical protein
MSDRVELLDAVTGGIREAVAPIEDERRMVLANWAATAARGKGACLPS